MLTVHVQYAGYKPRVHLSQFIFSSRMHMNDFQKPVVHIYFI